MSRSDEKMQIGGAPYFPLMSKGEKISKWGEMVALVASMKQGEIVE